MASALDMTELSDALKDDLATALQNGNAAYKKQDWEAAIEAYSAALALDSSSPAAAKTWANLAATRINNQQYDLAIMDAHKAVEMRPSFSKGYSRQAEAYTALQEFSRAHTAYTLAIEHAEDEATAGRLGAAAAKVREREKAHKKQLDKTAKSVSHSAPEPHAWIARLEALKAEGYVPLPGSAAHLVITAREACEEGLKLLARTGPAPGPRGGWMASLGSACLGNLAESCLSELRGFYLPTYDEKKPETAPTYKIKMQIEFQLRELGFWQWINQQTPPRDIIASLDARRKREGWEKVRMGMIAFVKGSCVAGQIFCLLGDYGPGVANLRFALGLLEEGEKMWKDVPYDDRAQMYRPSFVRMVRVALMQAIYDGMVRARTTSARLAFKRSEVQAMAKAIIVDCKGDSYAEFGNTTYLVSHTMAMARARAALGQLYFLEARENPMVSSKLQLYDVKYMGHAASAFRRACDLFPHDYPERPVYMACKLACSLYAGGLSLNEVFAEAAAIEASYVEPERLFGPLSRDEPPRLFVRRQLDNARAWLQTQEGGLEVHGEKILKPIAEIDVPPGPNANEMAQKYMDNALWNAQVGELRFSALVDRRQT